MRIRQACVVATFALCCANPAWAQAIPRSAVIQQFLNEGAQIQETPSGTIVTPASSLSRPEDAGVQAHTNVKIFIPSALPGEQAVGPLNAPPFSNYYFETPSSLACVYNLVTPASGCNPYSFHTNVTGGSKAIAIVDAYNSPTVRADLSAYSTQFGLPTITSSNFIIYYCGTTVSSCSTTGTPPPNNTGWAAEISLDVEMAHALAPSAKIYLVEALSNSDSNLMVAVDKASSLVAAAGGGEVSMSWGSSEFSTETSYDSNFKTSKVVYFAGSGDSPGTSWPCVSQYVACVGGASISRNSSADFFGLATWEDAGGGSSKYISRPSYQPSSIGSKRGVPDMSADANPYTGVWVYCSATACGSGGLSGVWWIYGGTSVATPSMAAIVNNAGSFKATTADELSLIYGDLASSSKYSADWYDVQQGECGPGIGNFTASVLVSIWAGKGYDFCTGVGAPKTKAGK